MEYITSGDRIAVENFEIGSIYKVTFLNETEVYFMCCGKGKDFVMMMSNEPRLFSLTMLSAAEVTAIDDYTPLPPPTPPTNLLQYQTGEPPFTFTTTDTELFSWYIKGPAGDKTANLCSLNKTGYRVDNSGNEEPLSGFSLYKADVSGSTEYTLNAEYSSSGATTLRCCEYDNTGTFISVLVVANLNTVPKTFTTSANAKYIKFSCSNAAYDIMLNLGSTPLPYEPHGYKIPILCNTTLSNIYINEALGENDILYSTDTTYTIATELGENLLQVQGETQPSEMQIVYKWEFEYE